MTLEEIKTAAAGVKHCKDAHICSTCPLTRPECATFITNALSAAVEMLDETTQKAPAEKPPLGLKPRWLHNKARLLDVLAAVTRYVEAGKAVPFEWRAELYDLLRRQETEAQENER